MRHVRHVNAVLSRGIGYEPTPVGRHLEVGTVRGYPLDFRSKTTSPTAAAPNTLVPAGLAQLALGWWERLLDGDEAADDAFRITCADLENTSVQEGQARIWPYRVPIAKYRLEPPWISGLAQAQAASVFVRAFLRYGEERHAALAEAAIGPLLDTTGPTVLTRTPHGPVPEECPTDPPSLILNGWIYAAWGLNDVATALESRRARTMYEEVVGTLLSTVPSYDAGWWSRYSLYPHRLLDLAKTFYHRLHVDQLEVTARMTGEGLFRTLAMQWRDYDTAVNRVRLVAQKAAFVASGYR